MFDELLRQMIRDEVREAVRLAVGELSKKALVPQPPPISSEKKYLSTKEAASVADVNTNTIRDWVGKGKLKPYKAGRKLRVERSDLDQFMANDDRTNSKSVVNTDDIARKLLSGARR